MSSNSPIPHVWKFFSTGGIEQVALETGEDLLALGQLDPKLWVALSCPVKGLELDERTLALIDTDNDARIGVPEVQAAVAWAAARLANPGALLDGSDSLPLAAIQSGTAEGQVLRSAAQRILAGSGKAGAGEITVAQAADSARIFAANPLNGEGVIPVEAAEDPDVQQLIRDILATVGGATRQSGAPGVTSAKIDEFFAQATAYLAWSGQKAAQDAAALGDATDAAFAAIQSVRAKVDDYFARCRLAAFDVRSAAALNRNEADYAPFGTAQLTLPATELSGFPLAHIEAGKPLRLLEGVNPAWSDALRSLWEKAVAPIWGQDKKSLTFEEWRELNGKFAAYEARLAENPGRSVEKIGLARVKEIAAGKGRDALTALVERDRALEPEFKALVDVERLVRYHRDLRTLLRNFVNFADFYSPGQWATFQAGTLILDSRSTELCLRVEAMSPLAAMSKMCIVACACTKAGGGASMTLVACFTQGDSDYLFVGRNGIFYDRTGALWYATITTIIDNPVSVRQAFWAPYKKFIQLIEGLVAKHAASADADVGSRLGTAVASPAAGAAKAPPQKFDLALITGIGVAIGSIGTFVAAVFAKLVDIPAWHIPLIFVGLILVISLPSVVIAWLKLRQRTLGPLLEANGWAINGRVKINIPFGTALTRLAVLPPGSRGSRRDPYADTSARRCTVWTVIWILLLGAAAIGIRWDHNRRGHYLWEKPPVQQPSPSPVTNRG